MGAAEEKEQVKRFQLQALEGPGSGKKTRGERSRDAQYSPAGPMTPASLPAAPEDAAGAHLRRERPHRPAWSPQE
jgi:hypothetical protein